MPNDNFEIIAFNGLTGECLTTEDLPDIPDADDLTPDANLDAIRQEHEPFLTKLEALSVQAIATNDWTPVLEHLNEIMAWQDAKLHEAQKQKVNAESLNGLSVDPTQRPNTNR